MFWPAVMIRVRDQLRQLPQSGFAFTPIARLSDVFAPCSRMLDTEFIKSGLGSAQLKETVASNKALPRRMLFVLVFMMSILSGFGDSPPFTSPARPRMSWRWPWQLRH